VREIFQLIAEINRKGTTILLVEQNAYMALSVADRAYVLETGEITLSGLHPNSGRIRKSGRRTSAMRPDR